MELIEKVTKTQEFATLPNVAVKILDMIQNDNVNVNTISNLVESDPSLTMKLIKIANSPIYGSRMVVSSVNHAIMSLGLNRLTNIVLGVSIFSKFLLSKRNNLGNLIEKFWWHSSCTAMVAKELSTQLNYQFKEIEFIGGILHDIGKLALLQYSFEEYTKVIELVESGVHDLEAEVQVFGFNHLDVGTIIAKQWNLPKEITSIVSFHNDVQKSTAYMELISVVRIADLLCEFWGAGFYEGINHIEIGSTVEWHILNKNNTLDIEQITLHLETEFKKTQDYLHLIID